MHILMIAPQPFFEARGTPLSEFHRIRALTELGHTVDLVTYPFGEDVQMTGLRIFRCVRPPLIRRVRVGPSFAKVPLDVSIACTAARRSFAERYDAIHSHEEGGVIGVALAWLLGVPHLYDMHSSLPQQLVNFDFSRSRALRWLAVHAERLMVRRSRVVIVICPELTAVVKRIQPGLEPILIENAPGSGDMIRCGAGRAVRASFGLTDHTPVVVYTGTFEAYQGLDLLVEAMVHVRAQEAAARLLLVGGTPDQLAAASRRVARLGLSDAVLLAGRQRAEDIPAYLEAADVLVSPRSTGTNTPLKIYQYLRSGRPIVATRLRTHTQVLDDEVAFLAEPSPAGFAQGILHALSDRERAAGVAQRALALSETRYSYDAYLTRTRLACSRLFGEAAPQVVRGVA